MGLPRPRGSAHRRQRTTSRTREVTSPALQDYPYGLVLYRGLLDVWTRPGMSAVARRSLADLLEREAAWLRMEAYTQDGQDRPVITPLDEEIESAEAASTAGSAGD